MLLNPFLCKYVLKRPGALLFCANLVRVRESLSLLLYPLYIIADVTF